MESKKLEDIEQSMQESAIQGIEEFKKDLFPLLGKLSKNEMERVIKNIANFPQPSKTNAGPEEEATVLLYSIKDLQVQLAITAIGRIQQEREQENE